MFVFVRAIVYATIFISFVLVYLPSQLVSDVGFSRPEPLGLVAVLAMILTAAGMAIAIWSVVVFATMGKGTPAPFDPPRRLVIRGPYKYVRNPMYIGVGLALGGAALFYRSYDLLLYLAILTVFVFLFIIFYEEPILKRMFGKEYEDYCKNVNRMWPRI